MPFHRNLYFYVLVAFVGGAIIGHVAPGIGLSLEPLGKAFVNLIKMMIGPIIFCTVVSGVAGVVDLKQAGRIGLKALIYFEVVTTLALAIGLTVVNLYQPGAGLESERIAANVDASAATKAAAVSPPKSFAEHMLAVIPKTIVSAFVDGDLLQVLLISILFAIALALSGEAAKPILIGIERLSTVLFKMMGLVLWVAPLGAFGAIGFAVGKYGLGLLLLLAKLMLAFYVTCALFIFIVLGLILWSTCGLNIWRFLVYIKEELALTLGTSSSESALPRMIAKLTAMGCERSVVGLVIPTGYSFNLDGTSIYLTMGAVFIAQATQTPMSLGQQISLLLLMMLTSKGASGVTGSGYVVLAASLSQFGKFPEAGLAMVFAIDRFMSEARAITNLIGNGVATVVVARWENALDVQRARAVLSGEVEVKSAAIEPID